MFVNPMDSLPGYGAILKNHFKLSTEDGDRTYADMYAAVLDFLIGRAWGNFGLWPKEAARHRQGTSIMELQAFLDWAFRHLLNDMEFTEEQVNDLNKEYARAVQEFMNRADEEEDEGEEGKDDGGQ